MQYWIGVLTIVGIYMIAVLGVSILCGFTGMFSMGHAGFMAIGGYVSALLTKNCGMPIFVAFWAVCWQQALWVTSSATPHCACVMTTSSS